MNRTTNKLIIILIATLFVASSCQKDKENDGALTAKAKVTIKLNGVNFGKNQGNASLRASSNKSQSAASVQYIKTSFNDEYDVSATLRPVTTTSSYSLRASAQDQSISTGALTEPLEIGAEYTLTVYEKGNESNQIFSKHFTHGVDNTDLSIELEPGEYTFLASGQSNARKANANYYRWREDVKVSNGQNTTLNIVLTYMLAEATITLNTGNIGDIEKISSGATYPNYSVESRDGGNINFFTGLVTYGSDRLNFIHFPIQPSGPSWVSLPVTVQTGYTEEGEVSLSGVTINGIEGNIHLFNLTFEEGVKYDLQLSLGPKVEKTYRIGGLTFARGNLRYDISTETYSFANEPNGTGHNFFPNFLKPKLFNRLNYSPSAEWNGDNGDPCSRVSPLNTWRLPTEVEIENLLSEIGNQTMLTNFRNGEAHRNHYDGVFFGTLEHPKSERYNYLFLPMSGYYENTDTNNHQFLIGRYLLRAASGGYAHLGLSKINPTNTGISATGEPQILEAPENMAVSIRCVKN